MRCKVVADVIDKYRNPFRIVFCEYETRFERICMLFYVCFNVLEHHGLVAESEDIVFGVENVDLIHLQ